VQINDYELGSSLMPFEKWESGEELFVSIDRDADLLDRDVRVFAEECDQMQGIQIYTGGDDAWGGFAARYVESLRDEFGKLPIWVWGIEHEQGKGQRAKQLLRTLNVARTIHEMSTQASMYIPLSIPAPPLPQYVHLDRGSEWHSSALLATAVESMTLPSRLRPDTQKRGLLGDVEAALNVNGNQRIAQLQCSIMGTKTSGSRLLNARAQNDDRVPSDANATMVEEDGLEAATVSLDINMSGGDDAASSSLLNQRHPRHHVFGAVEGIRATGDAVHDEESDGEEVTYAKRRRRFAGLPVIERFVPWRKHDDAERSGRPWVLLHLTYLQVPITARIPSPGQLPQDFLTLGYQSSGGAYSAVHHDRSIDTHQEFTKVCPPYGECGGARKAVERAGRDGGRVRRGMAQWLRGGE